MSQTDTGTRTESGTETAGTVAGTGREYGSKAATYLRRGVESGALTAIVGGAGILGGLRAHRRGERRLGRARLAVGAAFLAAAVAQRRPGGRETESAVEQSDVAATGPDIEAVADEAGGIGEDDHATGEAAAEVADTTPDIEAAGSGLESDTDTGSSSIDQREVVDTGIDGEDLAAATEPEPEAAGGATGPEDVDRLGAAAFDGQSREVPAPQRAFNRGFLAHSSEAFWGVREHDGAVLVSQDYDAVDGRDGVRFVAGSEIGDDVRELPVPDAVLDQWDEVFGGGTAVTGGDDVLFVTTDDLAADGVLRVLPAEWAEEAFGEE